MIISEKLFEAPQNPSIEILKNHFPQCFDKHGNFLPDKMAEELRSADIPVSRESYSMGWLGKSYARYLRECPPVTLLGEDTAHNALPENKDSQNLLIKGDNLEVLKHLKHAYQNKVKMIYIDPPYNTGSDGFVYQDDRKFTPEKLTELADMSLDEARRVLDFTAKKSNSHSAWLTFMYPRLYVARELLKDDGVIFISIDDNEQAQLKLLCDEVFGEENFVAGFIWNNKYTVSNDTDVSYQHEHILCYSKNKSKFSLNLLERTEKQNKDYKNRDNDPKGAWKATPIHARSGSDSGIYTIVFPNGIEWTAPTGRYPRYSKERLQELYDEGALYFNKNGGVDKKTYLSEVRDGITCGTLWNYEDVGHSHGNNEELADLLGKGIFSDPKGIALIERILKLSTSDNNQDIILDFFAGSGTTAHAVLNSNRFGGNRRFILIQLDEKPKKEAANAGYKTIFDITKARLEKASVKIRQDFPDYEGDLGFRIFETADDFRAIDDEALSPQYELPSTLNRMLSDEEYHTLLTTWRLYDGNALTEPVQAVDFGGYFAHLCGKNLYLIQPDFESGHIKALLDKLDTDKAFLAERIVLFGANVESAKQMELKQALDTYNNKKNLHLSLLVRY